MNTQASIIFTPKGLEDKREEFENLKQKRKEVVERLSLARSQGDLSENAAYKSAKYELGMTDRQLRHLEMLIKQAKVIQNTKTGTIQIGSTVTINDGIKSRELNIVGGYESNPLEGKISHHSPIGKALMGKKENETVEILIPSGKAIYKIQKVA